jgi:hypothetical protein
MIWSEDSAGLAACSSATCSLMVDVALIRSSSQLV